MPTSRPPGASRPEHGLRTPLLAAPPLSALTGAEVFVKYENLQVTNSFKERGACVKLAAVTAEERRRGVIAMSAGNHAQVTRGGSPQQNRASWVRGTVSIKSISARGADKIYEAIIEGKKGKRLRQCEKAAALCGKAWRVVHRLYPEELDPKPIK